MLVIMVTGSSIKVEFIDIKSLDLIQTVDTAPISKAFANATNALGNPAPSALRPLAGPGPGP